MEVNTIILISLLAFILTALAYPFALRYALRHNIVDNPEARKLQKEPIPVFGSVAVVFGMLVSISVAAAHYPGIDLWYSFLSILILFMLGVIDDVRGLSAWLRFIIEMGIVWILIWHPMQPENGPMIDDLHGLLGRESISLFSALPITILAGVGIINAINMIDGVDGYSSGFGILANVLFAIIFGYVGDEIMMIFSCIAAAALVPFYLHNVFGRKSKMFIGDGGSLVIGLVLANDVFTLLSHRTNSHILEDNGVGLVALATAILCIPIFDTLRVMFARIFTGGSPFTADKTHLHHVFISMGFSHVATSTIILLMNSIIVGLWYITYCLNLGVNTQFAIIVSLGIIATCGTYYGFRYAEKKRNCIWQTMCHLGQATHFEQKGIWHVMERIIDKTAFM